MGARFLATLLLTLSILATPLTAALQPATQQYEYVILFYYQGPGATVERGTGQTLEGVVEELPGQTLILLDEETGDNYQCSLVKWTITNPMERYEAAPLSTEPTSLYNYTHPQISNFINREFERYNTTALTPEEKMEAVLDWVYTHITYTIGEYPHYPWETLEQGKGDCDDMAVLAVTIARSLGVEAAVATGLLVMPEVEINTTAGNISYTIKGVAGHAWIVYRGWKGDIKTVDRLVPMDYVPEERRIVLEFPVEGPAYVNSTREAIESSGPSTVIIRLEPSNTTDCDTAISYRGEPLERGDEGAVGEQGMTGYSIVLAALILFTFTLVYVLWSNLRKAYLTFD